MRKYFPNLLYLFECLLCPRTNIKGDPPSHGSREGIEDVGEVSVMCHGPSRLMPVIIINKRTRPVSLVRFLSLLIVSWVRLPLHRSFICHFLSTENSQTSSVSYKSKLRMQKCLAGLVGSVSSIVASSSCWVSMLIVKLGNFKIKGWFD